MVPASGGTPRPLTTLDEGAKERTHRWPQVMPGGDVVLFTVGYIGSSESYEQSPIDAVRISTGERKRVLEGASFAKYAESGHLLFARGGFLFAVPFDADALQTRGTPVPVMQAVMGNRNSGVAYMDVSAEGVLAFIPGKQIAVRRVLMWAYPDGTREQLAVPADAYSNPDLSADGRRMVLTVLGDQSQDVWTYDIERQTTTRLTFKGNNLLPIWSPDGRWVAFSSDREGRVAVYRTPGDGSGEAERLLGAADRESDRQYWPTSWSLDGRYLAGEVAPSRAAAAEIWILSLEDGKSSVFLSTEHDESMPAFSPDGRWIAYQSDETGRDEIYVRPFPGPGGKWQLSARGGKEPYWSRDGSRVFFLNDARVWAVDVDGKGGSFRAARPRVVVENLPELFAERNYAVDPNGGRFLICQAGKAEGEPAPDRVVVVVNWFDELRRRR